MRRLRLGLLVFALLTCAARAEDVLTSSNMREDLRYLQEVWSQTDKSMSDDRRPQFEKLVAEISAKADQLTPSAFALEVSRAVAIAGNGHSDVQIEPYMHGIPIGFAWFSEGLFVVRTEPRFSDLLGARVEKFGALTTEEALGRVSYYISGTRAWTHSQSATYLRFLEVLHHIGAGSDTRSATLRLRMADGQLRRVKLGRELEPDPSPLPAWMGVVPAPADLPGRWTHVLDRTTNLPSIYRGATTGEREWLANDRVFYFRSNYIFGSEANRYELFARLMGLLQAEVSPRHPKYAIVDLRLNHGGDFLNTVSFAYALPRLIPNDGKIFVLVGPNTFSAALVTAAILKGQGGQRVVLVGETMGDDPASWAEGSRLTLPHSKLAVGTATKKHDWGERCTDVSICYWASTAFGSDNVSLVPEIQVETRFDEYARGRDPVLEAVIGQLHW